MHTRNLQGNIAEAGRQQSFEITRAAFYFRKSSSFIQTRIAKNAITGHGSLVVHRACCFRIGVAYPSFPQ
jgi:hypothetical protein